jgi:hypothetical protein
MAGSKFLHYRRFTIEYGDWEAIAFDIQRKVLAHNAKANEPDFSWICHFSVFPGDLHFLVYRKVSYATKRQSTKQHEVSLVMFRVISWIVHFGQGSGRALRFAFSF